MSDSWLNEAALVMNCRKGTIPFVYLGLTIGGDVRRHSFWKPVINHILARLLVRRSKYLSLGGRLIY